MDDQLAIQISDISKAYGKVEVLKGISLDVPRGRVQALLGPNGAGKTTLVRILTTLLAADSGQALVGGFDVRKQAAAVQKIIGLAGQYASVDGQLTGLENLKLIGRLYHLNQTAALARARELLAQFNLEAAADRPVKNYSGGMRRRLDLAASLVVVPPILFLDEPTTGLDPKSRNDMWTVIRGLVTSGTTLLLTTQYLDEADQLADNIAVINDGIIQAQGTPAELKATVGEESLQITLASSADFEKARKLFAKQALQTDEANRSISFSLPKGKSLRLIRDITDKCLQADIMVDNFVTHQPTLDEVFLQLTNQPAKTKPRREK